MLPPRGNRLFQAALPITIVFDAGCPCKSGFGVTVLDPSDKMLNRGAIPKFDMAERPSLLRLEYEHPNERRKDS